MISLLSLIGDILPAAKECSPESKSLEDAPMNFGLLDILLQLMNFLYQLFWNLLAPNLVDDCDPFLRLLVLLPLSDLYSQKIQISHSLASHCCFHLKKIVPYCDMKADMVDYSYAVGGHFPEP